ncbi:hypothetical protein CcaCcLH18_05451 [Colletotrichum camelliae]|nr:hypothetical protein CcaCcLH18_05451 [Colletotrichum camelliae]
MATFGYFTLFSIRYGTATDTVPITMYTSCENGSFSDHGEFWPYTAIQRQFHNMISESTDAPGTWALIQHWIRSCADNHTLCKIQSTFIPTRLLKLDTTGGKRDFRLIVREEVEPGSDYVALSHCWGTKCWDPDLTLGASTLTDLSRGKPLSCLPKTFKDAFMAVERLGLQYIWIDRLCILQDSEADWNRESSSMHNVFRRVSTKQLFASEPGFCRRES